MIDLIYLEPGIASLTENGISVLSKDSIKFAISRRQSRFLRRIIKSFSVCMQYGFGYENLLQDGFIKKLERQSEARQFNLWEAREPEGSRVIFRIEKPNTIIVSAVQKGSGNLTRAINRGINRWQSFLKQIMNP